MCLAGRRDTPLLPRTRLASTATNAPCRNLRRYLCRPMHSPTKVTTKAATKREHERRFRLLSGSPLGWYAFSVHSDERPLSQSSSLPLSTHALADEGDDKGRDQE